MNDGAGAVMIILYLAVVALMVASMWIVFAKAGEHGWAIFIPIYNTYVYLRIAGKPWYWILLLLIPFVNIVLSIMAAVSLARNFGKEVGFAIGIIFLPFIFYPMLAFGNSRYSPVPTGMSPATT